MQVNKKIGIVVAVEVFAVLEKYGHVKKTEEVAGFTVHIYQDKDVLIHVIESGAGQIAASAATAILVSTYKVDLIVNYGIVGGLTKEMEETSMCIIERVIHYDYDLSKIDKVEVGRYLNENEAYIYTDPILVKKAIEIEPRLKKVSCASGDKFLDGEGKKEIREKFKADICEMEAAGILITAKRAKVPAIFIKTVSDGIKGGAEEFKRSFKETSRICFDIADRLIKNI